MTAWPFARWSSTISRWRASAWSPAGARSRRRGRRASAPPATRRSTCDPRTPRPTWSSSTCRCPARRLEVIEAVGVDQMPPTIFVTAYDEYAVRAFEAQAHRLPAQALRPAALPAGARARPAPPRAPAARELAGQLLSVLATAAGAGRARTAADGEGRRPRCVRRCREIDWVEAEGNYARLHAGGRLAPDARRRWPSC